MYNHEIVASVSNPAMEDGITDQYLDDIPPVHGVVGDFSEPCGPPGLFHRPVLVFFGRQAKLAVDRILQFSTQFVEAVLVVRSHSIRPLVE
jgi:hypothetical protein